MEREARDPFSRRFQGRRTAAFLGGGGGDFSPSRGMGSYLYHVQFTLLNNHKLFQTLLQTFLKAIYTPILNYPHQQTSYVDAPPTELSIKEKEREERGRGRAATSSRRHDNLLCLYRRKEYSGDSNSWRERVLQSFPKGTFSLRFAKFRLYFQF